MIIRSGLQVARSSFVIVPLPLVPKNAHSDHKSEKGAEKTCNIEPKLHSATCFDLDGTIIDFV